MARRGPHKGRDTVVARFEEVVEVLGITHLAVERVVDNGDVIACVTRASGQTPGGYVPNHHVWGYVERVARGRLIHFRAYYDAAEALQAAGAQR
jgi:predicted SnoaL-like aldol condensation-catalyzing enzyme